MRSHSATNAVEKKSDQKNDAVHFMSEEDWPLGNGNVMIDRNDVPMVIVHIFLIIYDVLYGRRNGFRFVSGNFNHSNEMNAK